MSEPATIHGRAVEVTLAAKTAEAPSPRFALLAYTGVPMDLGREHPVVIDLATQTVTAKARPVLRDHDANRVVGHTTEVKVTPRGLEVAGVVSGENADSREVVASARKGFTWQVSGGWRITEPMERVPRGRTAQVNGRTIEGPALIARRTRLQEVSFVSLGADDDTSAVVAHTPNPSNRPVTIDNDDAPDDGGDMLHANGAPVRFVDTRDGAGSALEAAEIRRQRGILAVAAKYPTLAVQMPDGSTGSLADFAIEAGWSADKTELHAIRHSRPSAPGPRRGVGEGPSRQAVVTASLARSLGVPGEQLAADPAIGEQAVDAATAPDVRDIGLHGLLHAALEAANEPRRHGRVTNDTIRAAFRSAGSLQATGFTTISIPEVLSAVANKAMLAEYRNVPTVWREIAATASLSDFKPHNFYRLETVGGYRKIAADGELKHVNLVDAKFDVKADTHGAIIAVTRQDWINDDMSVLDSLPAKLGRLGAVKVEEEVLKALLANQDAMFHVNNGNLLSGASSALSAEAIESAELLFRNAVTADGRPILSMPNLLLTGTDQAVKARRLVSDLSTAESVGDGNAGGTSSTVTFNGNPFRGLKTAASPYVNNTRIRDAEGNAITGQGDGQWFLFANPADLAAIVVGFLNGRQEPTVETGSTDFDTLGVAMRAYHDWGIGIRDKAAAVKAAGA
ncbi:HK97 family phage prohead protease [Saccharicrinis sp. FJH54]|uniref:phage major capsid protein n=1 Tax=Saccharicrinis sp. FJH54 TaxID=3344665 RepID=UPI0035D4D970